jgi:hypothetical protein
MIISGLHSDPLGHESCVIRVTVATRNGQVSLPGLRFWRGFAVIDQVQGTAADAVPRDVAALLIGIGIAVFVAFVFLTFVAIS